MKETKKTSIGGQALIEGILMRGPRKTSIVVRKSDGELVTKQEEIGTNSHKKFWRLPFIRGTVNFWDSLKYGMKALTYSASFFETEEEQAEQTKLDKWIEKKIGFEKLQKIAMGFALAIGVIVPIALFILTPTLLAGLVGDLISPVLRNLLEGMIRIIIFICFIWITSKQSDVHRTYMYHGAEHKTIACYESDAELTVENVRQCKRFHPRCGTSFLFIVMIVSILVFSVVRWSNPFIRMGLRLALLPVVVGVSYELIKIAGRYDNFFTRILRAPGLALQRLTTAEPDDSMIEVAIKALKDVIPETEGEDRW
ncbi:MAG: DUF1385 domain-containing protein [Clostridia bacterium]|nr:DUF1385 domain-containing protein [Clostridia bacterium]